MRSDAKTSLYLQYAALPWRKNGDALEILLITTLRTARWIVPKGWPIEGLAPHASAAQEALEEAGIAGTIDQHPLGSFSYKKLRKSGETVTCKVDVFPLQVKSQRQRFAEKASRQVLWCSVEDAMTRVQEAGLCRLLLKFANAHRKPTRVVQKPERRQIARR